MIRRLRVNNYKSLQSSVVNFSEDLAVIIGPNGVGKRALFEVLGLLRRIVMCPTLEMAWQEPPVEQLASSRNTVAASKASTPQALLFSAEMERVGGFFFEVDVELSDTCCRQSEEDVEQLLEISQGRQRERYVNERLLRYRVEIEYDARRKRFCVLDEALSALRQDGQPKESRVPFLSRVDTERKQVIRVRLEGQGGHPLEYETGLPYAVISRPHHPPHYPHISAFKRELAGWRIYHFDPQVLRADSEPNRVLHLGPRGENLASFLHELQRSQPRHYATCLTLLKKLVPGVESLEIRRLPDGKLRLYVTESGLTLGGRQVADSLLLTLAALVIMLPRASHLLVGLHLPESGMEPSRIEALASLCQAASRLGQPQVLVRSLSPIFAESVPDKSLLVCRKVNGCTELRGFRSSGEMLKSVEILEALDTGRGHSPSAGELQALLGTEDVPF